MGLVKRMLEDYAQAVHPEDETKQADLMTKLCMGTVPTPTPEQIQAKIEEFRRNYERTEKWWESFWDSCGDAGWERPWLHTAYVNGTKFYDHNPTFSCISPCRKYAFRVLHLYEEQGVFAYWTDVFDPDQATIKMLTVSAAMSMALDVTAVIRRWIAQGYEIEPQEE